MRWLARAAFIELALRPTLAGERLAGQEGSAPGFAVLPAAPAK